MIAALLVLALAPAPVYVEADPGDVEGHAGPLHRQLMLRLLEEGYPLAPSAEYATRTLRVVSTPRGIRVEAHGEDLHAFEVDTGPVLPLEAVHRAMEALDEVTPRAEPRPPLPARVAVHVLQATTASDSPEAIRQALVRRLLAQDRTVVPLDADPESVLCAVTRGNTLALSRGADVGDCGEDPELIHLDEAGPDAAPLEAPLARLLETPDPATERTAFVEAPHPAGPTPTASLESPRDLDPKTRGPVVRLGARTGIYGRLSAADAAVGTTLQVGGEPGPGGLLDVLMVPSSAPDISIFETSVGAGFGWTWEVTPVVNLYLQGIGGLQVHRYRQRGNETGHRLDWTAEVPLGTSLRLARELRLDLAVRGGRAGREREHRVGDVVMWTRTAWRIGASVGLSYGWRPR